MLDHADGVAVATSHGEGGLDAAGVAPRRVAWARLAIQRHVRIAALGAVPMGCHRAPRAPLVHLRGTAIRGTLADATHGWRGAGVDGSCC